ncbi:MAG: HlyD family secretion protein [Deltaproteobacteria bacterium]|nr:HlyD family secretion protein [Deltaproteobacteria bacterium]
MSEEKNNNSSLKSVVVVVIMVLLIGCVMGYFYWKRGKVTTDDAYVSNDIFPITPRVTGYVTEVYVSSNQKVKRGQVLLSLDPSEFQVAVSEAKAVLAERIATLTSVELSVPLELNQTAHRVRGARAQLRSLRKTMEMAVKEQEAAEHELKRDEAENSKSLMDLRRMKVLMESKAVSQLELDEVETRYQTTLAQVRAAKAREERLRKQKASLESDLDRIKANIELAATGDDLATIKSSQVEAQKAAVELARARLKKAELDLEYTTITSSAEGFITRKLVEKGQMVSKGQPLMAVASLDPETISITANFKETQITHVRPGQSVTIKVDTYPDITLKGKVDSIMAGTGTVFSLFPPENATGNFVKVVQRIPVKIVLNEHDRNSMPVLRIGMSVIPTIYTGR